MTNLNVRNSISILKNSGNCYELIACSKQCIIDTHVTIFFLTYIVPFSTIKLCEGVEG